MWNDPKVMYNRVKLLVEQWDTNKDGLMSLGEIDALLLRASKLEGAEAISEGPVTSLDVLKPELQNVAAAAGVAPGPTPTGPTHRPFPAAAAGRAARHRWHTCFDLVGAIGGDGEATAAFDCIVHGIVRMAQATRRACCT